MPEYARWLSRAFAVVILAASSHSIAQVLTGTASAADGDSLVVGSQRVRLFGIDAPELDQTCQTGGNAWQCGADAKRRLNELVAGQRVDCQIIGTDQYGRSLGKCSTEFLELNEAIVELGWAVAYREYSQDYVEAEERAKLRKAGIWNSTFTMPSAHRLANAPKQSDPATRAIASRPQLSNQSFTGCTIKGNRNRKGQWIYHLPGMPYYDKTRAEEFFCTEAQARAAGYRRAIVQ